MSEKFIEMLSDLITKIERKEIELIGWSITNKTVEIPTDFDSREVPSGISIIQLKIRDKIVTK